MCTIVMTQKKMKNMQVTKTYNPWSSKTKFEELIPEKINN
jgi:hypothetical protein